MPERGFFQANISPEESAIVTSQHTTQVATAKNPSLPNPPNYRQSAQEPEPQRRTNYRQPK